MKKTIFTIVAAVTLAGCSKFLEEHSQNASYIESPADLEELLYGDALSAAGRTGQYLHLLADESQELYYSATAGAISETAILMNSAGMFRWLDDPFTNFTGITASATQRHEWDKFYDIIAVANSLIENAAEFDQGDPQVAYVAGSAYFLRALNYFRLVNTYGEPYSKDDPDGGIGVPYKSTAKIDQQKQRRQSTGYIYDRIVEDLTEAAALLEASGNYARSQFKVSEDACHALMSRAYLYMERYGDAVAAADRVENLTLFDLTANYPVGEGEVFLQTMNNEIIFGQGDDGLGSLMPGTGESRRNDYDASFEVLVVCNSYRVADGLWEMFGEGDVRRSAFFTLSYELDMPMIRKVRPSLPAMITETDPVAGTTLFGDIAPAQFSECGVLRAAEVVLNKAEAQALAGDAGALQTIVDFVKTRYTTLPAIPTGGDELIEFIRDERRRELCFEGHRWFDLRRYAVNSVHPQAVEIVHEYYTTESNQTAIRGSRTLLPYSEATKGAWVLPVPQSEIDFNWPEITNLDRGAGVESFGGKIQTTSETNQ